MDYRMYIQNSIDYIEEHLQECMTVDELASIAGFSPYHYYRVFNAYVGIPVMEYIRRRRLAYAAAELVRGKRIIDIAMDYGFDTHNGFAKALFPGSGYEFAEGKVDYELYYEGTKVEIYIPIVKKA